MMYSRPDGMIIESVKNGLPVLFVAINYIGLKVWFFPLLICGLTYTVFGFATSEALGSSKSVNRSAALIRPFS